MTPCIEALAEYIAWERRRKASRICFIICAVISLILLSVLLVTKCAAGETIPVSVMRVVDGDTFRVWDGEVEYPVRLVGVDTPESRPNRKAENDASEWRVSVGEIIHAGKSASNFTAAIAPPGIEVGIVTMGNDRYGRTLAYVYLPDGRCINEILLKNGVALARYRHSKYDEYKVMERSARERRIGFWNNIWKKGEQK